MFEVDGVSYEYNTKVTGERCVELPIAYRYIERFSEDEYFEVGFVLAYYLAAHGVRKTSHFVIDKYEKHPRYLNLQNIDIVDYVPEFYYKACFCISTLEHIGWDIPETHVRDKQLIALDVMRGGVQPGGFLFVTVPFGYSRFTDDHIRSGKISFDKMIYLKQVELNIWEECDYKDVADARYANPFLAANGLLIGIDNEAITH